MNPKVILIGILLGTAHEAWAGSFLSTKPDDVVALQTFLKQQTPVAGYVVLGDMLFRAKDIEAKAALAGRPWTNGVFVYRFEASIDATRRAAFTQACNAWTVNTPLTCKERTTETNYAMVRSHEGGDKNICGGFNTSCSSIGMTGGEQPIWVYSGQWTDQRTLSHEVGHALGLMHEQSRPDRDQFIWIKAENVKPGALDQFAQLPGTVESSAYDYLSIMHYSNCAYTVHAGCNAGTPDLQTIVPKACHIDVVGGNAISELDLEGIRNIYAPGLQGLFVQDRRPQCGQYEFTPTQIQACGANCPTASATTYKKIETLYDNWCGFTPIQYPETWCPPINKTYIRHWWDTDTASCGFFQNRHELWVECGCPVQAFNAFCTDTSKLSPETLGKALGQFSVWKDSRLVLFNQIMTGLKRDGLISEEVVEKLGAFYQKNYLDPLFETKFMRARAGIYSYAHWKRRVVPNYELGWDTFRKIALYRKLRVPAEGT